LWKEGGGSLLQKETGFPLRELLEGGAKNNKTRNLSRKRRNWIQSAEHRKGHCIRKRRGEVVLGTNPAHSKPQRGKKQKNKKISGRKERAVHI